MNNKTAREQELFFLVQKYMYTCRKQVSIFFYQYYCLPFGSLTFTLLEARDGLLIPASFSANTLNSYLRSSMRLGILIMFVRHGVKLTRCQFSVPCSRLSTQQDLILPPPSDLGLSHFRLTKSPPTSVTSGKPGVSGASENRIHNAGR